jgi:hypothetical protein
VADRLAAETIADGVDGMVGVCQTAVAS